MDRDSIFVSVCGIGILAGWLIKTLKKERKAVAAAEAADEKTARATARAVRDSIKARR